MITTIIQSLISIMNKNIKFSIFNLLIFEAICIAMSCPAYAQPEIYEVVFKQARVIDPETHLDAIRDVGITGSKIVSVSETPLKGLKEIDAHDKVLGPGFIDLHTHAMNVPSFWMQAFDGVTSSLELEAGAYPINKAYAYAATLNLPLNYGYSASWGGARMVVAGGAKDLDGTFESALKNFGKPNWSKLLSPEKSAQIIRLLEQELLDGGLGIGIVAGYAPLSNREEYVAVAQLANKYDVPTFTHLRAKNSSEPNGAVEGFLETIGVAAGTGARMHICHINSTSLTKINDVISLVSTAQNKKVRITTEAYPVGSADQPSLALRF